MTELSGVEKLTSQHNVKGFRSSKHVLNDWLKRYALNNQKADSTQTYVVHRNHAVAAYYSLVYGSIAIQNCPPRVRSEMPEHFPVPIMKIARLAVDKREEGRGLGRALMKDAFIRILSAAEIGGLRAIVVDAMDEVVAHWYRDSFGFEESLIDPLVLFLRIADLRHAVAFTS